MFFLLLATVGCVVGATSYESKMQSLLDCKGTARTGFLPCGALWPLNGTVSNADPARREVDAVSADKSAAQCGAFMDRRTNTWGVDYVRHGPAPHAARPPAFSAVAAADGSVSCILPLLLLPRC